MKTNKLIALASFLVLGFVGARTCHAGEGARRGQVQVGAAGAKAVVVGPTAIHAYSAFSGAKLFVVDAVTGTDADCQAAARRGAGAALAADRIHTLNVRSGQVACVAADRGVELLWHAQNAAAGPVMMAANP